MWKILYKDRFGGQNPDFWYDNLHGSDVGYTKNMGREDYMTDIFTKYFPKKGKILDGGCGVGQHVLAYRDLGYEIEGIDFSDKTIERILRFDNNAPCRKGNILEIDAPDSYYGCYYSIGVFEHFEEGPIEAIKEARRVLGANGIFILSVPYENLFRKIKFNFLCFVGKLSGKKCMHTNIGFIKKVDAYYKPDAPEGNMQFHEYICSKDEIIKMLVSIGFKIEYSTPCSIIWGLLEMPFMGKIYKLFNNSLRGKGKLSEGRKCFDKIKRRGLLKDMIIYEKRNSALKNFFVTLIGSLFGNLFLVVCRKV